MAKGGKPPTDGHFRDSVVLSIIRKYSPAIITPGEFVIRHGSVDYVLYATREAVVNALIARLHHHCANH